MKINEVVTVKQRPLLVEYAGIEMYAEQYCQPYLNEIGGFKNAMFVHPLYRGMSGLDFPYGIHSKVINVNQDRYPTDTPIEIQVIIDNWFESKFGVRFRQTSMHSTGNIATANGYSSAAGPLIIIPIGEFNYAWSMLHRDMFDDIPKFSRFSMMSSNEKVRRINQFLDNGDYRFNRDLIEAIHSNNEIMVSCKKALVIQQRFLKELVL